MSTTITIQRSGSGDGPPVTVSVAVGEDEPLPEYRVMLDVIGPKKIQVIKEIRGVAGVGLKEAKRLAEAAPGAVFTTTIHEHAEKLREALLGAGAQAHIEEVQA